LTGLHASALAVSPNGRFVVCANAAADNLSVIDTRTDAVVETIWVKAKPSELFGASPNALVFEPSGRRLYVANGTQNAVAVVSFDPVDRESKLEGLIPVGWFPAALVFDAARKTSARRTSRVCPRRSRRRPAARPVSIRSFIPASLSLVPVPAAADLPKLSEMVQRNLRRAAITAARIPARANQPARTIPERIGEPSRIKHVVYIIKENRTYDQVLGAIKEGNGDPALCISARRSRRISTSLSANSCCSITPTARESSARTGTSGARRRSRRITWRRVLLIFRGAIPTAWAWTRTTRSLTRRPASSGTTR